MKKWILSVTFLISLISSTVCCFSGDNSSGEKQAGSSISIKRAVSLKTLQQKLKAFDKNSVFPDEITRLGGLNTIEGYIVDAVNRDIILVGSVIPGLPPLYLEDFIIALRNSWLEYAVLRGHTYYYSDPGCSIDPNPSVIQELMAIGKSKKESSSDNKEEYIAEWNSIGKSPQTVRVLGIPFDTHFAWVMVKADYDMKSLVDGSDSLDCPGFSSLMDMTMEAAKDSILKGERAPISSYSLNRFWFFPGKNQYQEDKNVVIIEKCPVVLLTEEQYINKGKIAGSGGSDPLALKFAESFAEKYNEISGQRLIYIELENLFRFVALAKIMKFMSVQEKSGLDLGYFLKQYSVPKISVDRTLPGRTNVKIFEDRKDFQDSYQIYRLWLPSCGGVGIAIKISKNNFVKSTKNVKSTKSTKSTTGTKGATGKTDTIGKLEQMKNVVLKTRPSADALSWDF